MLNKSSNKKSLVQYGLVSELAELLELVTEGLWFNIVLSLFEHAKLLELVAEGL